MDRYSLASPNRPKSGKEAGFPKPPEPSPGEGTPKFVWLVRCMHDKNHYIDDVYSTSRDAVRKIRLLHWEGFEEHLEVVKPA